MIYPLLEVKDLCIEFRTGSRTVTAVEDITFTINRNEILGIAGESGSGKSVTSLAILRLLPSRSAVYANGSILFSLTGNAQQDLVRLDDAALRGVRGGGIAMIFQEPMSSLNPVYTCGDQVMEALQLHRSVSAHEAREQTMNLFARVRLPDPRRIFTSYPHELSGGQKQRVMIAMAMSGNPSLLICDEPTTALDVTVQRTVLELLKELQAETGMGVMFISHDLAVIAEIADRALIMNKGRIVEQGPTATIFRDPQHPYTRGLLACRPALHTKGERLPVVADFMEPAQADAGKSSVLSDSEVKGLPVGARLDGEPRSLITIRGLSVLFPVSTSITGKVTAVMKAVDDVNFDIIEGETLGLVGESGCGKSTLGRAILRLIKPTAGTVLFDGRELQSFTSKELKRFRKNMQIIFQDPYASLNPSLTVGSALEEPLIVHEPRLQKEERRKRVIDLLEKVGLGGRYYDRYPHEFSGGQRQRIVIARALVLEPSFIVCDESVSALDVSVQAQVLNLLNELKRVFGFTSLFISHDLSVIRYISDRIIVMNKGRIEEIGEAEDVYLRPQSEYTARLIGAIPRLV